VGFIAEFTLSSPLVRETTQAVPGMTFEMEDLQLRGDQPSNYVFWAIGGDFEQLEDVLDEDSTVADFVFLTRIRDRLLCRVTFTEESEQRPAYPTASAYDIVYPSLVQRARGATSVPRSRLARPRGVSRGLPGAGNPVHARPPLRRGVLGRDERVRPHGATVRCTRPGVRIWIFRRRT
jgi:hypothetical protein